MVDGQTDFRNVLLNIDIAPKKPRGAGIGKCGDDKQEGLDLFTQGDNHG
jgi:hypothetical protein